MANPHDDHLRVQSSRFSLPREAKLETWPRWLLTALFVVALCASIEAQSGFSEEASARGVALLTAFNSIDSGYGYAMALSDLDGDGDIDLILTGRHPQGGVAAYENDGLGHFSDHSGTAGLPSSLSINGVSTADYDGDGDLDLYFSVWPGPNLLYRNDGNFAFTNVTAAAGVGDAGASAGSAWGDYDGDGWLDLYVANNTGTAGTTEPNRLYRNRADGTFEEVGGALGVADATSSFQPLFFDYDRDGDADLYLSNDNRGGLAAPTQNRLWRNDGGVFTDVSASSGTNVSIDSMGIAAGDFDGNGEFDLYCTNSPPGNPLLLNYHPAPFVESAVTAGVRAFRLGWATHFFDFDHSGHLDLFVVNFATGNQLFSQAAGFPCPDVAPSLGIADAGFGYCSAVGDLDGDGDLDLVVQAANEPIRLYMNHEGAGSGHWLKARLRAPGANRFAVGAQVQVVTATRTQVREVMAGVGFKGSNPMDLHFGLGTDAVVEEVIVRWPSGLRSVLTNLPANQTLVIDEAVSGFVDCDGNLVSDAAEIALDGTLDLNGDSVLDTCQTPFLRGDANVDGVVNLADVIFHLEYFVGTQPARCLDAQDSNDDGMVNVADAIYSLGYLFTQGPPPSAPYPDCGLDESTNPGARLDCESLSAHCP